MQPSSRIHCVIHRYPGNISASLPASTVARFFSSSNTNSRRLAPQSTGSHHLYRNTDVEYSYSRSLDLTQTCSPHRRTSPAAQTSCTPATVPRQKKFFSTTSFAMSSDDAYMSFLDKANADLNAGQPQRQGTSDTARTRPAQQSRPQKSQN